MPGVLIVFWTAIGLGSLLSFTDPQARIWYGVDHSAHSSGKLEGEVKYDLSTNYPYYAVAQMDVYGVEECKVTVIATHTRRKPTRLILDGEEQELGIGWSIERSVKRKEAHVFEARFLDPIGGKELAVRTVTLRCSELPTASTRNQVLYDERGLRGYVPPNCPCAEGR